MQNPKYRRGIAPHSPRWALPLACALLGTLALLTLTACGSSTSTPGVSATSQPLLAKDANGTPIQIPAKAPQRIVSLGASDSEILAAIGADDRVVAVDNYTNYPADLAAKKKISDANATYNVEAIIGLQPDLVLSFGGETATADKQLMAAKLQVVDLPATNLTGTLVEIRLVGQLVHNEAKADALVNTLQQRINSVTSKVSGATLVSTYMEIDYSTTGKPFVSGGGSFGDELIRDAGGTNIFGANTSGGGYPQVSDEAVISANPQVIVLTNDPSAGGDPQQVAKRAGWSNVAAVKAQHVYVLSSDETQRAGPRLVDALEQLAKDLHPELFK